MDNAIPRIGETLGLFLKSWFVCGKAYTGIAAASSVGYSARSVRLAEGRIEGERGVPTADLRSDGSSLRLRLVANSVDAAKKPKVHRVLTIHIYHNREL